VQVSLSSGVRPAMKMDLPEFLRNYRQIVQLAENRTIRLTEKGAKHHAIKEQSGKTESKGFFGE
jgi:hypothetical protein